MFISSPTRMQQLEADIIASGVSAETLMNDVSRKIAEEISRNLPFFRNCVAFAGKGNNGGDAIAILRFLREKGWNVSLRSAFSPSEWSPLAQHQLSLLKDPEIHSAPLDSIPPDTLLLDGILGLGGRQGLSSPLAELCSEINLLRSNSPGSRTWAIDLPSGLDGNSGTPDPDTVIADFSSPIGRVKQGMVADTATRYTGRIIPIPMEGLPTCENTDSVTCPQSFIPWLRRDYELFKNKAGHVGVIAGSPGMTGAAKLCAEAALRAGAGLVTLMVREDIYPILASSTSPAIMVKPVKSVEDIPLDNFTTLLIGPGLGTPSQRDARAIGNMLKNFKLPIILDADGLNMAAQHGWKLGENILATPHPGEMKRLLNTSRMEESRKETAERFTRLHRATLILKGARSIIAAFGKPVRYNISGGPGMATAGQGDVLAGVCAGLCAQGLPPYEAASLAAYLCGKSSDIVISLKLQTEQTLTACDTLSGLSRAFFSICE